MRVLVVDQDSASNLAITRSLRDLYTVDCVTNKGDCLDLLRSNTFEVIVATERLEDGSGLELLGQISKKWPSVLRIFAADRQRLQLLRGRLGPFELFQTLTYPIDSDKLLATLQVAAAAHGSDSQEVELPSEVAAAPEESADAPEAPAEARFEVSALDEPLDLEQSDEFSEPRFARAGRGEPMQATSSGRGVSVGPRVGSGTGSGPGPGAARGSGAPRARRVESTQRESDLAAKFPGSGTIGPRRGPVGATSRGAGGASGRGTTGFPRSGSPGGASGRGSSELSRSVPQGRGAGDSARGGASRGVAPGFESDQSSDVGSLRGGSPDAGSRVGAPRGGSSGRPPRSGRVRSAASKAPPVRFPPLERIPPLERTPPLERVPPLEPPQVRSASGDFSEAAAMARAARSNYESSSEEFDTKRLATLIGGGVAVAVVVLFLGFKMFGSKSEAPKPAAPPVVAHAPEYPPEVTQLVAQTEAAFKADDFKAARADVDRLRQLSPSHPRLDFFQGLLLGRAEGGKGAASGRGAAASSTKKTKGGGTSTAAAKSDTSEPAVAKDDTGASATAANPGSVSAAAPSTTTSSSADSPGMMPETPVGLSRDSAGAASAGTGAAAATGAMAAAGTSAATTAPGAAGGTSIAPSASEGAPAASAAPAAAQGPHTPAASTTRRAAGEPPPVVQEAKLIRRVNPDYPSAAKKDGIAGSVDLEVTVSAQGVVENVSVIQATPPDMFDKSAVAAVRKWKYDPRFVDGLPSQAHLKVHLEFGPNK